MTRATCSDEMSLSEVPVALLSAFIEDARASDQCLDVAELYEALAARAPLTVEVRCYVAGEACECPGGLYGHCEFLDPPGIAVPQRITPADIWRDDDSPMSHRP